MLQKGNRKLPKSTGIFNIPAIKTCPNCGTCKEFCYARKAERMYPNALPYRERMLELSKKPSFVSDMVAVIIKSKVKTIRIHESGDFYSQSYVDNWTDIARQLPDIQFYAYTKSIHLDFDARPSNMRIISSVPCDSLDGIALIVNKNIKLPGFVQCPGDCKKCSYCYAPNVTYPKVTFNIH